MVKELKVADKDEVIITETTRSSATVWKVSAVILVGLLMLFVTDSIEIKKTNQGELIRGDVHDKVTTRIGNGGTVDVEKKEPAVQEKKKKEPLLDENETPRHSYKNRGQPMPEALAKEQTSKWGDWKKMNKERPQHDFYKDYPNRDVPRDKFPSNAWQLDKDYMKQFLTQGKDLVMRAMEAILAEYGHGVDDEPGVSFADRAAMFNLRRYNLAETKLDKNGGLDVAQDGGWTTDRSWEGLKRRILHAIMTEDSFNFAMAGHSSSAGHGNHFSQSYTLQVAWIMEPIFARLGVKHQSRNFGNGGLGTQHNAFAGGSIWGPDVDMLMWDSGMTEGGNRDPDLMMRQGMIGGMKVPVLWNFNHPTMITYHEKADVDIILNGAFSSSRLGVPQQDTLEDIDKTVWASKFLKCGQELKGHCRANEYNGTCWVERPDLPPPSTQKKEPGGRAAWHPGNRIHQILGRTLAMTILFALHDALTMWSESGSEADAYKLEDHVWHVTEYYENQRTKVQLVDPMETGCGAFEKEHGIGWVCKVPFKGRTEFTPRAYADLTSLRSIMPTAMRELVGEPEPSVYEPPDVYNPTIHPPLGEIDVLNIVEAGPEFKSVMDPQIYKDFYETPKDNSMIMKPGKGFKLNTYVGADRCDGTLDSWCNKGATNPCLLTGHNDNRGCIDYDGYSGWLVMKPKIKYGYVAIKYDSWHGVNYNSKTEKWTSINNEAERRLRLSSNGADNELLSSIPKRELKVKSVPACEDFRFEWAIDGKVTSINHTEFLARFKLTQRVVEFMVLLEDPDYTGGEEKEIEVAIRIIGCAREQTFALTHIYYA